MSEFVEINGINFHVKNVLKMKKKDFLKAYGDEDLWQEIQKSKPKSKKKKES